jgi:transcriptional antiterminator Rof (Rho-off)
LECNLSGRIGRHIECHGLGGQGGVSTRVVYDTRRHDAEFARAWRASLCEGYDALEMALLYRLRVGELKPATGAKRATRSDNATALRLLAAHRETVARERAIREEEDADAILASINMKLEKMRERWLAAKEANEEAPDAQ